MLGLIRVVSIDPVLNHIADFLQASAYLTACTALLLLRAVYNVGYSTALGPEKPGDRAPAFLTVLDVVMDCWPTFGIFCILFMLRGKICGYSVPMDHITPSCLGDDSQRADSIYSHGICLRTADNVNSTLQKLRVYEMLQVTSQKQQTEQPQTQCQTPCHPANCPQLQQHTTHGTFADETDDDLPPDYYSTGHQVPVQHLPYLPSAGTSAFQPGSDEISIQESSSRW